jgi:hypothetical protein
MKRKPHTITLALLVFWLLAAPSSALAGSDNPEVDSFKPESADEAVARRDIMIGKWLGEAPTKDGGVRRWLAERFEDGTYRVIFQLFQGTADYHEQVEVGHWGIVGPIYFTIYRGYIFDGEFVPVDPSDPDVYDAYEILELGDDRLRYRSYSSGSEFRLRKVADNYRLDRADGT